MSTQILNVGVDVGGTNMKFGVTDENGNILLQNKKRTYPDRGSDAIVATIIQSVKEMLARGGIDPGQIRSMGLGVPGTTDSRNGVVAFAPNIFWRNVEIVKAVRRAFDIPVFAVQDTRAAAWAEYLIGAGKGLRSMASVTLGTGIGCGMVFDGRIFHGGLNTAGEFGHQIVQLDGNPCNCGRHGCLEAYAGGLAIVREAREHIDGICELLQKTLPEVAVQDVFNLAQKGNAQARRLTESVVKYLGMGLVNLINLNSVEFISISGGICNAPEELLLTPLIAFVRSHVYESVADKVRVCKSQLGEDAPMIGAALLYHENPS